MDDNLNTISQQTQTRAIITSPNVVCECGCKVFQEGAIVKKVSRLVTGSTTDTLYPIPVYYCIKCGEIPKEFLERGNAKAILGINGDSSTNDTPVEEKKSSLII